MNKKYFKKQFGQNFLQDNNIINKIVETAEIKNKKVIEIGPGKGAMTSLLIEQAQELTCFEIDNNLYKHLKDKYNKEKNIDLINGDFLKQDLSHFQNYYIVANIPYNITSDIIFKILENNSSVKEATLMVQKEVAKRMSAKVGKKDYGKLAITISYYYDVEYLFDVSPKCFYPEPKVTSSIIKLKRKEINKNKFNKELNKFIVELFSFKRKNLLNNLKNKYDLEIVKSYLKAINKNESIRSENLTLEEIIGLYNLLKTKN